MHILYILDFYKPNKWWIEILFEQIISHFSKKHKISIITWNYSWNLPTKEKSWNITIYRINAKNLTNYVFKWYNFSKNIVKDVNFIHTSNFYSALIWSRLAKKYKKKSILHINWFFWNYRFQMTNWIKAQKFKILENMNINWNFNKYIVVSRYIFDVANFHYWIDKNKIEIIYNWIDYKSWKENINEIEIQKIQKIYNPENKFFLLFYGRVEKVKWIENLLESIRNIDWIKLLLILHGNIAKIKKIIKDFWIENKTQIINWKPHTEIPNYIKASNCVVFPSLIESFGYVALETSILNVPLLCTNIWAIPEIAYWKVNFFEPKNSKSLEDSIKKSIKNKFEIIPEKNFDIKNTLEKLEKVYFEMKD